ncbi:MAG: hypothetical protein RL425_1224, partial [Pseudomonadota bacterium]
MGNEGFAFCRIGHTGKGHGRAGHKRTRAFEPFIQLC